MSADESERTSRPGKTPEVPKLTDDEVALREAENGLRQFDRLVALIEGAVAPGAPAFRLRPSTLTELNRIAVEGLLVAPGSFRHGPIGITNSLHHPPPPEDVPAEIDGMCDYVHDHWDASPVHLSSYVMWRLNWIHPFNDGNGRTSRAASYLVLCARLGLRLPGTGTIPERIAADKQPYYLALDAADAAWRDGRVDVSSMEHLVSAFLAAQLVELHQLATGTKAP
ncbi:MAG: Fic family protein [Labilithrix sp.]|nr:Fic family protein [Labilithrix sp.]